MRRVHGEMSDAVLAGEGLARVAQLASRASGSPILISVPQLEVSIIPRFSVGPVALRDESSAALDAWVLERLSGREPNVPPNVLAHLPVMFRGRDAGVTALMSGPSRPRPEAHEVLYFTSLAVMMELAIVEARLDTEETLRGSLIDELRSGRDLNERQITQRLARFGCHIPDGAVVLCVEPREQRPRLLEGMITREYPGALVQTLQPDVEHNDVRVVAVLPAPAGCTAESALADAERLAEQLARHGTAGTSSFRRNPTEIGEAIHEAELVVDVLRHSGTSFTGASGDHLFGLLFRMFASHPEEMRSFHHRTIGPLIRHDDQYQTGLIDTLSRYLESNCNMNLTAEAMFAHRHTIAHRLRSIHELSGLDPTLSEDRERLGLGLKIHRLVAQRPI